MINWIQLLVALGLALVVGFLFLALGMWLDKRREDKRLGAELCAMQAEIEAEGDDGGA